MFLNYYIIISKIRCYHVDMYSVIAICKNGWPANCVLVANNNNAKSRVCAEFSTKTRRFVLKILSTDIWKYWSVIKNLILIFCIELLSQGRFMTSMLLSISYEWSLAMLYSYHYPMRPHSVWMRLVLFDISNRWKTRLYFLHNHQHANWQPNFILFTSCMKARSSMGQLNL